MAGGTGYHLPVTDLDLRGGAVELRAVQLVALLHAAQLLDERGQALLVVGGRAAGLEGLAVDDFAERGHRNFVTSRVQGTWSCLAPSYTVLTGEGDPRPQRSN